jgi:hypothetical protein
VKVDGYGAVVREKHGYPGDIGDACADTARLELIALFPRVDCSSFRTPGGYVRHPDAPAHDDKGESWREDDFSSDQAAPLLMSYILNPEKYPGYAREMLQRLSTGRTGDGNRLSPGLWAIVNGWDGLMAFLTLIQALIFLFPLRWSDAENAPWHRLQWGGDEGDYLNWIAYLEYMDMIGYRKTMRLCYWIRSPMLALKKVTIYYANQPNSLWVVQLYTEHLIAVRKRFGGGYE